MQTPPIIVDQRSLIQHRERAGSGRENFLRRLNADDVQERLKEVNRSFTDVAIVTPTPEIWHPALPGSRIVSDDGILDLEQGSHDVVIHDLCLHWANDPVGQLVQCRRALRPDGLLIATLFGGQTLHELRSALAEAEVRVYGGLSPRVVPMADIREMGALLQRAGLALPVADSATFPVSYASPFGLMRDLRAMGEGNALSGRLRTFTRRAFFAAADEIYRLHFEKEGRIPATFEIITLTGWAPSETQPKALRPGSASTRLADVLGTSETSLLRSDD